MPVNKVNRRDMYWDLHDFGSGRGLEIGPLHRTIVHRDKADVRYVDVHDQAGLRTHYAGHDGVDPELIPEIDYTLIQDDGRVLSLPEATAAGAPFAWVVASHVIEHVPDVIGWLAEVAEVVNDGAALVLAVPDRRYCFDVNRPPTTVGQMLDAHRLGDTRPSVRAVYDYFSSVVDNTSADLWAGRIPDYSRRIHTLGQAVERVAATEAGEYVDCHVWLFSPQSFVEQMHELRVTGRSDWMVEEIVETPAQDVEFRVRMRRLPRASNSTAGQPGEIVPSADRPDWLTPVETSALVSHLEKKVVALEERLRERRTKLRKTQARRTHDKRTIERQGEEIAKLRGSRQWKVGAAALAPLRMARRLRRG